MERDTILGPGLVGIVGLPATARPNAPLIRVTASDFHSHRKPLAGAGPCSAAL